MIRFPSFLKSTKGRLAFLHDLTMTVVAIFAAYYMRFGAVGLQARLDDILLLCAIVVPISAIVYWGFGLYRGVWRFASIPDLMNILKAVTIMAAVIAFVDYLTRGQLLVPRSVPVAYWFVQCALLGGSRLIYRAYRDQRLATRARRTGRTGNPVLIAGSGYDAEIVIRAIETHLSHLYRPVGLVVTGGADVGQRIRNVPILAHVSEIESAVSSLRASGAPPVRLIVMGDALHDHPELEAAIVKARQLGLHADRLSLPGAPGSTSQRVHLAPVRIEDLLGRPTHELDRDLMRGLVAGKRVLVTGAGGSIGGELCRQILGMDCARLMILDHSELALYQIERDLKRLAPAAEIDDQLCDVRDRERIGDVMQRFAPDLVFHAAALKHLPIVERHVGEGIRTNVTGTMNVADAARSAGVHAMVLISTDKAVQPTSFMGATKRVAESYCEALDALSAQENGSARTRFFSVRFGNVLGSSGSVVPLFKEQLEEGGPITVTHPDMQRYFMTISEAVSLVLMASAHGLATESRHSIYVLDMGKPVRIVDLAERMIRLAGLEPGTDVEIVFTGLRKGEKLYEELFHDGESLHKTDLQGILVAEPRASDASAVIETVKQLSAAVDGHDSEGLAELLVKNVPEYCGAEPPKPAEDAVRIASL